ncbi:DUF7660 family protein [Streptomyces platensis]|uniref:DUF7660 family protein n=1 Tax=Streptomyces platensis TaxID=58346 RepID=UPI001F38DDBC|nr:hypothetical protein [Streptomyces platensis]MCF3145005.1 hypothetical protein [Streptomyces platensis]
MDSREALASFVRSLRRDYAESAAAWDNADLGDFLEALAAWVDDAAGWYRSARHDLPDGGDWAFFARALSAATVYE